MKRNNYYHWIKLQRRYRSLQVRFSQTRENRLARKLDIIGRRLHALNRRWKLGISASLLTAWLAFVPNSAQAQVRSSIDLAALEPSRAIRFDGINSGDNLGASVASAGDLNGDGYDDLIIGAVYADVGGEAANNAGSSYVIFGGPHLTNPVVDLTKLDGTNGFRLDGEVSFDYAGISVSSGNINGDQFSDLIISARGSDFGPDNSGSTYVIFGTDEEFAAVLSLSDLNGANGFRVNGANIFDYSGASASASDINGDGIDDLLIGATQTDPVLSNEGSVYVVFGKETEFSASIDLSSLSVDDGFRIDGFQTGAGVGTNVSSAGDINNDGVEDLIITSNSSGTFSYVVLGDMNGFGSVLDLASLDGYNGFSLSASEQGASVSDAGDVNNDGYDDLMVGIQNENPDGESNAGSTYVLFGSPDIGTASGFGPTLDLTTLSVTDGFRLNGVDAYDRSGSSVSSAGDINGDGIVDILIGAEDANPDGVITTGAAYVVFGKTDDFAAVADLSTLDGNNGFILVGGESGAELGSSVSSAGDFNGDNLDDFIIGSRREGTFNHGRAYLVFGFELDAPYVANPIGAQAAMEDHAFSLTLNTADFVDPGGDELSFSASLVEGDPLPGWLAFDGATHTFSGTPRNSDVGTIAIAVTATDPDDKSVTTYFEIEVLDAQNFPTSLSELNGLNGFRLDGEANGDQSGASVSAAGDINNDGIDDLIIGAYSADPGGNSAAGSVYVVFGKEGPFDPKIELSSLDGTNGFRLDGPNNFYRAGTSVSNLGDINGDQVDDLIIGANGAGPAIPNQGSSYVIFGSDQTFANPFDLSSVDGTNGFRIDGQASGDRSGSAVSYAGDINNDDINDLIIGAPEAGPGGVNFAGSSYVVFGSSEDFTASLSLATLTGVNGFRLHGTGNNNRSGVSVAGVGDVNGDGIDDLLIGAFGLESDQNKGGAYIVFGSNSLFSADTDLSSIDGSNGFLMVGSDGDEVGHSVELAGDFNHDGIDDLIVGASYASHGHSNSGSSYIIFGSSNGFNATLNLASISVEDGFRLDEEVRDAQAGGSVSGIGDFNSDGVDDIAITGRLNEDSDGFAQVVFGSSADFDAVIEMDDVGGLRFEGEDGDRLGSSISSAGDINNDGIDDLIIGSSDADPDNRSNAGSTYVIFGRITSQPPTVVNPIVDQNASEQEPFSFSVPSNTFDDPNNQNSLDEQTLSATGPGGTPLPAWLSFDASTGTFSGTPGIGDGGLLNVTVTSTDEDGLSGSDDFEIAINSAPQLTVTNQTLSEESELSLVLTATDADVLQSLSYSLDGTSVAKGMNLEAATGELTWTPAEDQDGTHEVIVTVTDGLTSVNAVFTITVDEENEAPTLATIENQTVDEGTELGLAISGSDDDDPVQLLTYTLDETSASKGMTIAASTGAFSWTPGESQDGMHEVTVMVADGITTAAETFTIEVSEVNSVPVLDVIPDQTTEEGGVVVLGLSATDSDVPSQQLSFTLDATSDGKGMMLDEVTGVFDWVPGENHDGTHEVTVTVDDGLSSASEMFTITVNEVLGAEDWTTQEVMLYPNPTRNQFMLVVENSFIGEVLLNILDVEGKVLQEEYIDKAAARLEQPVQISHLEAGVYFLELRVEGERMGMQRIVKK